MVRMTLGGEVPKPALVVDACVLITAEKGANTQRARHVGTLHYRQRAK